MMKASTLPWMSSAATGSQTSATGLPSLSLLSAGLVPPVKMRTLLGMVTAVAAALVTDE